LLTSTLFLNNLEASEPDASQEADVALQDAFDDQLDRIESSLDGSSPDTLGSMDVIFAAALPVAPEDEQGESLLERDGSENNRSAKDPAKKDEYTMLEHGLSHRKRSELVGELTKLGMSIKDATHRATQVLKYEKNQKSFRPLTTFMWILTIGVVVMASLFAVIEVIAMLTYWILFGLIGCSSYAGLYNWRVKDWNSTAASEFQGKMTGKDIMRCSAKAIWIFVYAPLVVAQYALKLALGLIMLPFWLVKKFLKLSSGGQNRRIKDPAGPGEPRKPRKKSRARNAKEPPGSWIKSLPGTWDSAEEKL